MTSLATLSRSTKPVRWYEGPKSEWKEGVRVERARRARQLALTLGKTREAIRHQDAFRSWCRQDIVYFVNNFVWCFDPREMEIYPFVLFPVQEQYLRFVEEAVQEGKQFVCEKSRDIGVSYLNCAFAVHYWLFVPNFKTTFCANKLDLVDVQGNPDTIFEKMRGILRQLPQWLLPYHGFSSREARLVNYDNGNIISGEGGENAGRGGRSTLYIIDEAAFVERADKVNAATSANARSRGWCSSVNGNGNLFFRLRHSGKVRVFTAHWKHDPRKDAAWAVEKRAELTPAVFASEYDIDYGASIEGLMIPALWVEAARELFRRYPEEVERWRNVKGTAGMDIGGGAAECVVVPRHGPVIEAPHCRRNPDSVQVAYWGLDICRAHHIGSLNYDSVGVGFGIGSILGQAEGGPDIAIYGVNVGDPPTELVWPDKRTSREKFANLKAELWWRAREAFNRSYLLFRHLNGEDDGIRYAIDEVILLGDDDELARQLSMPRWFRTEKGKRVLETKDQLRLRGIASPDRADAAILSLHEAETSLFYVGDLG
jgi:hypothetical protein